ncbi:hypothetical protein ACP70R_035440 [Stipagrostis hirtigluma subsp. patula]
METGVIVLSVVVGLFGVLSAVLGFIAEATKLRADDIAVYTSECVYPSNPAFALGLCAVLLLAVAQITVSAAGGCCGCCRPRGGAGESRRVMGIVCSVLSWIAAVIAGAFYLQGAAWNAPVTRETADYGCYYLKGGVFTRAAVLTLAATVLGIKSYILLTRTPAPTAAPTTTAAGGVEPKPEGQYPAAVGMPQWPAQGYAQAPYPQPAQGYVQAPNPHFAPAPPKGQANVQV